MGTIGSCYVSQVRTCQANLICEYNPPFPVFPREVLGLDLGRGVRPAKILTEKMENLYHKNRKMAYILPPLPVRGHKFSTPLSKKIAKFGLKRGEIAKFGQLNRKDSNIRFHKKNIADLSLKTEVKWPFDRPKIATKLPKKQKDR